MDFMKKMRKRLYIAVGYIIIGVIFAVLFYCGISKNQYLQVLGITLIVMGIARTIQYKAITKDEESVRRQRITETDERNIAIVHKAKSLAFSLYVFICAVLVIVLEIIGEKEYSTILALSICALVTLYWICFFIYHKRS